MASSSTNQRTAIRSAEADRISSCRFADRVATLSIEAYRRLCPRELVEAYQQTVVAAILVHCRHGYDRDESDDGTTAIVTAASPASVDTLNDDRSHTQTHLQVVSIGVGTKTLPSNQLLKERARSLATGDGDRLIRDGHAEVRVHSTLVTRHAQWFAMIH